MPRLRARVDVNHPEIVAALRQVGASVQSLATIGQGCPDLLVSYAARHVLLEVKSPGGTLTPDEAAWIDRCGGPVYVVYTVEDALAAIGITVT